MAEAITAPEETSVWQYNPSLALAILASILYGIVFLAIFYLTFIKYRSWYFTCVVVGAAVEVVGYGLRCYSVKRPSEVVCHLSLDSLPFTLTVLHLNTPDIPINTSPLKSDQSV